MENPLLQNVQEIRHPLIQDHVTALRDKTTPPGEFRGIVNRLSALLAYEATRDLTIEPVDVKTPLARAKGGRLKQRIGLVPIIRAGLGMVDSVLNLISTAEVRHLGFYRDEKTFKPVEYYKKLPAADPVDVALILDPMLATGGSIMAALDAVKEWGVPIVKLLSIVASPEGIQNVQAKYPETRIYICAIDSHLNEQAYIVPGLGDAGDRMFKT